MLFPLAEGARLRLVEHPGRPQSWRAELCQETLVLRPDGPRRTLTTTPVALGLHAGDTTRAEQIVRRLAGAERAPLERTLVLLGSAIAAHAGLVGAESWTMDVDGVKACIVDRHGNIRSTISTPVPGWVDLPGRRLEAGQELVPRALLPAKRTSHGRTERRRLLAEDLAILGLPVDLPDRLGFDDTFHG